MLDVMSMQWYVNLVTIAGAGILGWIVLEVLGKPIRTFFDLRDQVRAQLLLLANVAPPKPRETISTSLEIQQYDVALKAGREAQRILRDLGSQMLAFSESEIAACNGIATFGFDAVAAGRGLIALSNTYYRLGYRCGPFPHLPSDPLNDRIFDASIFHALRMGAVSLVPTSACSSFGITGTRPWPRWRHLPPSSLLSWWLLALLR